MEPSGRHSRVTRMKVASMSINSTNTESGTDRKRKKFKPPPSFLGNVALPVVCSNGANEDSFMHEVTRRAGGYGGIDSAFTPVFEPVVTDTYGPSLDEVRGSTISRGNHKSFSPQLEASTKKNVQRAGWNLTDVPTLPELHHLERTAVGVPDTSVAEVAARVSKVLYERSIETTYNDTKAKAKCMSPDHVDFRVRLYRGRNEHSNKIIVEVQRRNGSSVNFHNDTKAILNAAEGKEPPAEDHGNIPLVSDSEDEYEPSTSSASSLEVVSRLLQQPGIDSHGLALEILESLTDPSKMGISTARANSKAILEPDNDVGTKLMSMVSDTEGFFIDMRIKAMQALTNAISIVEDFPQDIKNKLRPVILDALWDADSNPRMAHVAAKCVEGLLPGEHHVAEFHGPLQEALAVGLLKHAGLAFQAELCIKLLG